jgi:hypothetical protein
MLSVLAPLCLLAVALVLPAAAQNYRQITAKELHQNASRHLKQRIELKDAYCYSLEDNGGYECGTGETLTIRAKDMAEGPLKAKIEAECGGLDAIEQTPNCRTNVRFIATAVSKEQGEVMRGGKLTPAEITIVTADTLTPVAAR